MTDQLTTLWWTGIDGVRAVGGRSERARSGRNVTYSDVAITGAGFGGPGATIRLKQSGIDEFIVFHRATDVGGTWRDNSYPCPARDVPSHLYSYSFALTGR